MTQCTVNRGDIISLINKMKNINLFRCEHTEMIFLQYLKIYLDIDLKK